MITVVESSALGPWSGAWDALVLRLPVPTPFLRSWWLEATAEPTRRYLLCIDDGGDGIGDGSDELVDGELVGGLALFQWRRFAGVPVYRLAGDGALSPDHLDLVRAPGREHEVAAAVRAWFAARPAVLDARGVAQDSLLARSLPAARVEAMDVAPWEMLPGSFEEFQRTRSTNLRREMRRTARRLEAAGAQYRPAIGSEVLEAFEVFERLHRQRGDRGALVAQSARLRAAVLAGAEREEAWVSLLTTGAEVLAVEISFWVGGVLFTYQGARTIEDHWRGVGSHLLWRVLERACAEGGREIDLLRGDEEYKYRLAGRERRLMRIQAASGARARVILGAVSTARRLRSAGRTLRAWAADSRRRLHRAPGADLGGVADP